MLPAVASSSFWVCRSLRLISWIKLWLENMSSLVCALSNEAMYGSGFFSVVVVVATGYAYLLFRIEFAFFSGSLKYSLSIYSRLSWEAGGLLGWAGPKEIWVGCGCGPMKAYRGGTGAIGWNRGCIRTG